MSGKDLDKDSCTRGLTTRLIGRVINFHGTVNSTNDIAQELAEGGAKEGTVVISTSQTGGKGRLGRTFHSPKGGIYLSIVLRPDRQIEEVSCLPLVMGLAVSKAIQCTTSKEARLKWPNDILIEGLKVSGILLLSSMKGSSLEYVILGIGINVNTTLDDMSPELHGTATSMLLCTGKEIDVNEFTRDLLYFLDLTYTQFLDGQKEHLLDQWNSRSETLGKMVKVETKKGHTEGKALGVDQTGALIIHTLKGLERVDSGDCMDLSQIDLD